MSLSVRFICDLSKSEKLTPFMSKLYFSLILRHYAHRTPPNRILLEQKSIYTHITLKAGIKYSVADRYIDKRHGEKATRVCVLYSCPKIKQISFLH